MPVQGFGDIAEKLRRSTVQVRVGRRGHGSGVIVKADGVIVTNAHVAVADPIDVELWDGTRVRGNLSARDAARDVAILHVPIRGLPEARLTNSDELRAGELVIAVGNPLGFTGALSRGVIHTVGRVPGLGPIKWIQSDVTLAPGNSGGPLANAAGHVVGINTMVAGGIGLAVPSNTVLRLLKGGAAHATLGIIARPIQLDIRRRSQMALLILEVIPNSPAERASLMIGDLIVGAGERALDSLEDFEDIFDTVCERVVRLQFLRGDRTNIRSVAIRLGVGSTVAA